MDSNINYRVCIKVAQKLCKFEHQLCFEQELLSFWRGNSEAIRFVFWKIYAIIQEFYATAGKYQLCLGIGEGGALPFLMKYRSHFKSCCNIFMIVGGGSIFIFDKLLWTVPVSFIWRCNDVENRSRAFFGCPHGCFPQRGTFLDQGQSREAVVAQVEGAPRPGSSSCQRS